MSYGHIEKLEAQLRVGTITYKPWREAKAKIAERVKERDELARRNYEEKRALRKALCAKDKSPDRDQPFQYEMVIIN